LRRAAHRLREPTTTRGSDRFVQDDQRLTNGGDDAVEIGAGGFNLLLSSLYLRNAGERDDDFAAGVKKRMLRSPSRKSVATSSGAGSSLRRPRPTWWHLADMVF